MLRHRVTAVAALSVLALSAAAAPSQAHEGGRHDGHRGHHGHDHARGISMTLTDEATTILDDASAEVTGSGGARVGRTDDDLIVISLGGRHRGSTDDTATRRRGGSGWTPSQAVVEISTDAATSSWSGFAFDRREGVITADVDGVEDVPVLTLVRTDDEDDDGDDDGLHSRSRGHGSAELVLTEESADALDGVVGSDAFAEGDVFATAGGRCGR